MRLHRNAKTSPKMRQLLVTRVTQLGWSHAAAAAAAWLQPQLGHASHQELPHLRAGLRITMKSHSGVPKHWFGVVTAIVSRDLPNEQPI